MPRWLPQILFHKMELNPAKCKEMFINFLPNSINHIVIGNNVIEQVENYKIFIGVIINNELQWNNHADFILKKASKKLYSLRILCRVGVAQDNILKVFLSTVRPVLEYAVPVWQAIVDYLSDVVEGVQKRALRLIFPVTEFLFGGLANSKYSKTKEKK